MTIGGQENEKQEPCLEAINENRTSPNMNKKKLNTNYEESIICKSKTEKKIDQ